ncbi:type VI-B CRISPR-associated RNA-guided ribonuclease Cas13b [Flavobacterium endoglycinae]|uniref:Type VI-B CRISPR-associated RNA-guided ribonuclease Cas13b n=1 Tax=Flavobacterium endoglycinae TaxID=2816357 RepID=A0ABX7QGS9_9FLAO|nr:type VI-B CRISPR-associated RNA-guided ribonuclease Cas13b [Flavobacterium endoglycinae]QSW89574.1 type VI-B CRISPR-associated RNA-guided ribonuclease Cas13b [Flavobacterium endoglycinae]
MENKATETVNYFDHTLLQDKHYFSGFLNLAENNIDTVFRAFAERYKKKQESINKKKQLDIIGLINESFSDIIPDAEYNARFDFIKLYFPVTGFIEKQNNSREYFREKLIALVKAINNLRNFYSHYYHKKINFELEFSGFFDFLDHIFLDTVSEVKKHKMKDDKTRHLLSKNLSSNLGLLYNQKKEQLQQWKKEGKKVNLDELSIKNSVLNDSFFHLIYKKDQINLAYSANFNGIAENEITISQSGLLFLLSMFLTKKESEDLRAKVKGFKAKFIKSDDLNNSIKFMATHWVFSYLAFKGNKHRLVSQFQQENLLIQIIDELSKVPNEVYVTLDKEKQNSFIEDINEYLKTGNEDLSLEESTVVHSVIRKRYENKFNYFALRYLDEFAGFPTLRFQIHLGNFVHDRRTKDISGTVYKAERVVKEKITLFSRLTEVSNLKSHYIINKKNTDDETGWEIFPNPSYNLAANNIPIFINLQKSKVEEAGKLYGKLIEVKRKQEKIDHEKGKQKQVRKSNKLNKEQIAQLIDPNIIDKEKNIYVGAPLAMLSLNELPALLYELLFKNVSAEVLEDRMVAKLVERFKTIQDYEPSQNLSTSFITKKLRKSSQQERNDTEKIVRAANREIEITNQKLAIISQNRKDTKNRDHKRKYVFTTRELGIEATWFANDIKRFMPKEYREQLKGYQFAQIQHSLSKFDQNPNEVVDIISSIWNFKENQSDFSEWMKVTLLKFKSFDKAYEEWLKRRDGYFKTIADNLLSYESDPKRLKQFIKQQHIFEIFKEWLYKIESTQEQIQRLLLSPLVFARGIFDDKPTFIKNVHVNESPELYADWYRYTYESSHQFQTFYDLERDYKEWFDSERLLDKEVLKNEKELNPDEQFAKVKLKQDLRIKRIKTQDLFLKLIAEKLYNNVFNTNVTLELKDFYLTQNERLEKEKEALKQNNRKEGDTSQNIIKDSFIWSKTISFNYRNVHEPAVKLKDLGKFKNYLKDSKVQKLLEYDIEKIWTKQMLDDELFLKANSYETIRRENLLKLIQDFERKILGSRGFNGHNHPSDFEQKGNPHFKCYVGNGILKAVDSSYIEDVDWLLGLDEVTIKEITTETIKEKPELVQLSYLLILIRNKFSHNQLIDKKYMEYLTTLIEVNDEWTYSQTILEFVEFAIKKLLINLNAKIDH